MSVPEDQVQRLLEQGLEIPDDPIEIERLLESVQTGELSVSEELEPKPDDDDRDPDKPDDKPDETPDDKPENEPDDKPDSETREPPGAILRQTRESLHNAEEALKSRDDQITAQNDRIEKLEGRLALALTGTDKEKQDLEDKAGEVTDIKLDDLTDDRIAEIREEAGDEAADLLIALSKQNKSLSEQMGKLQESAEEVAARREELEAQELQTDLDAIPLLSVLQASRGEEADQRWQRAVSYEKAVRSDPDWQGKSRRDVYQEVGRRMESFLGADVVAELTGDKPDDGDKKPDDDKTAQEKVDEALERADDGALPTSLSDLPAGQAAAQSEFERAEAMSLTDVENAISGALEKGGSDAVDEALYKFMTADT